MYVYRGVPIQQGAGLGSVFKKFLRYMIPHVKEYAAPIAKTVGKELLSSSTSIIKDAIAGENIRKAAKRHLSNTVDTLSEKADKYLDGKGKCKHKKRRTSKKYLHDIFSV